MILGKSKIKELIKNGLVENMVDVDTQIQHHGIDLTIGDVLIPWEKGIINFENERTHISGSHRIPPTDDNIYHLTKGQTYIVKLREVFSIPHNIVGLIKPIQSLIQSGAYIESGIYPVGYNGPVYVMLHVGNPYGIDLINDAKICQLILFDADEYIEDN